MIHQATFKTERKNVFAFVLSQGLVLRAVLRKAVMDEFVPAQGKQ